MTLQTSKFRRLFQALSVLSAVVCALLIALWIRSYWWSDWMGGVVIEGHAVVISTWSDFVAVMITNDTHARPWAWRSYPISETGTHGGIWGWFRLPDDSMPTLIMPHWFLVLVAAGLAAAPWIDRFKWRFSLRTLLIATTLVAAVLGMIAWAAR